MEPGQLLKRVTVCKVANHKWAKIAYPGSEGAGYFLRCLRCGKERHGGTSVRPRPSSDPGSEAPASTNAAEDEQHERDDGQDDQNGPQHCETPSG